MTTILAYWDIRGLAQPIRMFLNYVGEEFEDKYYSAGPAPDFDRSCWLTVKDSLGLDYPNLPYLIDGEIKLTQSNAIFRHLARKHSMYGNTVQEQAAADLVAEQAMDFRNALVRLCYNPKANDMLQSYLEGLKKTLADFEKYLDGKKYFIGDGVTFVDFIMHELLDQHRILFKGSLDGYNRLNAFLSRFEALPRNKEFLSRPVAKFPCNNTMAAINN